MRGPLAAAVACLALSACTSHPSPAPPTTAPPSWQPCPSGFRDTCMSIDMPLDWTDPRGPKTPVFVSRALAFQQPAHADLWLLQGGPGESAGVFYDIVDELRVALPGVDIYTMEHRGVGQSGRLGCPDQESPTSDEGTAISLDELPACLAHVDKASGGLANYRITAAANDLAHAIDMTRSAGHDVFVYGVSYGTAVAIRYMQLRPNDARGVVLDSVAAPGIAFFSHFSEQSDPVLHRLAELCAADSACSAVFSGADPWTSLSAVSHHIAEGGCPDANLSSLDVGGYAEGLLQRDDARVVAMALLHRLDRCAPADLAALQAFGATAAEMGRGGSSPAASRVLYYNIVFSDLWERPAPSLAELKTRCDALSVCSGGSLELGLVQALWPSFPADPLAGQPIETSSSVLILNGTLDPQTPIENATALAALVASPHKTFVSMPTSAHATISQAEARNVADPPCGYQVLLSFLKAPEAPDTSCADAGLPVSFRSTEAAETWFGTADLWDNDGGADGGDDGGAEAGDDAASEATPEAAADGADAGDGGP